MVRLEFSYAYSYESSTEGIPLPVVLSSGAEAVDLLAFIDTGASHCLIDIWPSNASGAGLFAL
jgi:hypothetical protein